MELEKKRREVELEKVQEDIKKGRGTGAQPTIPETDEAAETA